MRYASRNHSLHPSQFARPFGGDDQDGQRCQQGGQYEGTHEFIALSESAEDAAQGPFSTTDRELHQAMVGWTERNLTIAHRVEHRIERSPLPRDRVHHQAGNGGEPGETVFPPGIGRRLSGNYNGRSQTVRAVMEDIRGHEIAAARFGGALLDFKLKAARSSGVECSSRRRGSTVLV